MRVPTHTGIAGEDTKEEVWCCYEYSEEEEQKEEEDKGRKEKG
jgi:hypothetical protein